MEYEKISDERMGEVSEVIRERVEEARAIQRKRFLGRKILTNSEMTPVEVREFC